ncbi:bifunctional adenosylcobinamide kinase/adenosylcobinamide-phosphate guanylyltransferase [Marinactinospora thermotolerans]|uniref:bifunctional adenosylcobinamide kinase/adenosylcobinamide-phosphate guanylyltransferase n=1 Tax=Marinactinospora thermotolerans TaxID=531310 RepID=UPI00373FD334
MRVTVDDAFALTAPDTAPARRLPPGYHSSVTEHGVRIDAPDGTRLLYAASGACADLATGSGRHDDPEVDLAIVDVGESASVIGALRRCGVVGAATAVAAVGGDHRVHSPAEFARRARLWGALAPADGQVVGCPPATWPPERVRGPYRVLVTGGARSGKSSEAERRLLAEPEVTYIATGPKPTAHDPAWSARVTAHRERRPWWWRTEETLEVAHLLENASGAVLLDCVGTWLAGVMEECGMWEEHPRPTAADEVRSRIDALVAAWRRCPAHLVAVTNEVGSGVVPATVSGGLYRDWLGRLNQALAAESEEVTLAVAGRIVELR